MKKFIPQYEPLIDYEGLDKSFSKYFKSKPYITEYKKTREFENEIKKFLGVKHCFVMNNGTVSLSIALLANGIKPGDEVIVPALSMIATANAVKFIGAKPVFVDIDKNNLCMDLNQTLNKINKKTKGIIYVSLNGRQHTHEQTNTFLRLCDKHHIEYIEDNAQSFGSKDNWGCEIGRTYGISSFSFSMPKIITTGQGGCLTTNNDELANRIKHLKDHGRDSGGNDTHNYFGINSKFTDLQAILGLEQIKNIEWRIKRKIEIYGCYRYLLEDIKEIEFIPIDLEYICPWFVDIFVPDRNELIEYLKKNNIGTRKIYPVIPHQKIYNVKEKFPVAEYYSSRGLWLPSSMALTDEDIGYICEKIRKFYEKIL